MNKNILGSYKNGNYYCTIFEDGTKIRLNNENYMRADRPESIDINISNKCDNGCAFCYQKCVPDGAIADFTSPLFDSIPPYTEIALNGNGIFDSPDFNKFIMRMTSKRVICNITVHAVDLIKHYNEILDWTCHGWIHGVGVSVNQPVDDEFISRLTYLSSFSCVVVHVIAGVVPWETLVKLSNNGLKLLILGYKDYGRGTTYLENHNEVRANINKLKERIGYLYKHFKVVSFDNLALEQLDIRATVDEETWEKSYMGEDGSATFFIDAVANTYARSSISERIPIDVENVNILFRNLT